MTEEIKNVEAVEEPKNVLTKEQVESIGKELDEISKQNESVRLLENIKNEDHSNETGEMIPATIIVDPDTGEKKVVDIGSVRDTKEFDQKIADFGETLDKIDISEQPIELKDIKEALENGDSAAFGKYDLSDEATLQLLDTVKLYKEKGKIGYKDLPDEVKKYIDEYLKREGLISFSVEANTARNMLAESLIEEFISNIEINKFQSEFNDQIENIMDEMNEQISPLFKDYNDSRESYLNNLIEKIEDEDKKKLAERILDSIHDSFALERFKEAAPRIKVKKFDIEKPQKIFNTFVMKYRDNQYKIYDPGMITNILDSELKKHNLIEKDDMTSAIKVIVAFCKLCQNYSPKNPDEHAFIYYFTYNITLLKVYKKEQYDEYAPVFLGKIKEVLDLLK